MGIDRNTVGAWQIYRDTLLWGHTLAAKFSSLELPSTENSLRIICFRHPSSESSRLQFALEFIQESPIRVLSDELLRAGLDQPCFVHA
jgi:hypothetical protein